MEEKKVVIDPIHGPIEIPTWLTRLASEKPSIRRMMLIRQLGLKAYLDFPGAIHTRYSHALGAMHLASKITSILSEKAIRHNKSTIADILDKNKNNIVAAAFFHDVAHGPFSHATDYVLRKILNKTHEEIAREIICSELKDLENFGISVEAVSKIINRSHRFNYLSQIVNGPLDVDKLDYLLRDSYHVGLRYSFDLDHFINGYIILGEDISPEECDLGLRDSIETITSAQIFLLIWRSMYELVYYIQTSRIAEKMLEKALLLECQSNSEIKEYFTSIQKYTRLYDEHLLRLLEEGSQFSKQIVEAIFKKGEVYQQVYVEDVKNLSRKVAEESFIEALNNESRIEDIADQLSLEVCEELKLNSYSVIVDIIRSKIPETIHLENVETKTSPPNELKEKSEIIKAFEPQIRIKAYVNSEASEEVKKKNININKKIEEVISGWRI
jgi:HD superfamily phosphohydrolase